MSALLSRQVFSIALLACALQLFAPALAHADEVLDWNAVALRAIRVSGQAGFLHARTLACVHAAIFDAVNGIERRFTPIHVEAGAPRGASRRAAAVQAAYATLVALFPSQATDFAADLKTSLARIAADAAIENSQSIRRGREWGKAVADAIIEWRNRDGLNPPDPPYLGSLARGTWRPTPLAMAPGAVPTLGRMVPFAIPTFSSFRSPGPPPLTSLEYAADVNEVKLVGELTAPLTARTADQTESARFWAGAASSVWNRAAATAALRHHTPLSENARLFALLNIAAADAIIAAWDNKYFFELWRPITAIRLANTDGNSLTVEQADWTPLIVTPPYPEYDSGHQSISGASQAVLTAYFGPQRMEGFSEGLAGVVRQWASFKAAADDAFMARIWAGIHFRFAMRDTRVRAEKIAAFVLANAAQPLKGRRVGQLRK
jgi:hypothetical protein